jgi:hypothetical protein
MAKSAVQAKKKKARKDSKERKLARKFHHTDKKNPSCNQSK